MGGVNFSFIFVDIDCFVFFLSLRLDLRTDILFLLFVAIEVIRAVLYALTSAQYDAEICCIS